MKPVMWLLFVALLLPVHGRAETGPQELVEQTTNAILERLVKERESLRKDNSGLYDLLEEIVLPHFDFIRMSALVLGKNWRLANEDQKLRFSRAFRTLLVRTYGVILLEYTNQKIRYLPLRDKLADGDVTVHCEIIGGSRHPTMVNYRLYDRNGDWKVYDIIIDGISLVTNFRTSYAGEIKQNGLDALITRLDEHNAKTQ